MSANKPISMPADYKGLKMRIQSSKVLGDQMKALGAIPQVMAFSEVYQALQTGVVDGTENPPSNFYTQKMHEVQKYLAMTDHGDIGYAVIVNKKFWDGLPADIRTALEGAMKDATKYANDIAKKENDDALEAVKQERQDPDHHADRRREGRDEEGAGRRAQGERVARRQGHRSRRCTQATRVQAVACTRLRAAARRPRAGRCTGRGSDRVKILDRLEEWLIAFLMGAATLVIFVAVLHRYARRACRFPACRTRCCKLDLSWAQELCIYMFVWMAKFGAAYGVRTGIHVGVDVLINRLPAARAQVVRAVRPAAPARFFTGVVGTLGAKFSWDIAHTTSVSPDLEMPKWIVYLCIPLGSYLMCFRFLQVAWTFARTGELPRHDVAHVEGIDVDTDAAAHRPPTT